MTEAIETGYQVYAGEGVDAVGAVRELRGKDLVIDIEGAGDFVISRHLVTAVHDEKVILDVKQLDPKLLQAIAHAHDQEGSTL
jgi:hypothetical protein